MRYLSLTYPSLLCWIDRIFLKELTMIRPFPTPIEIKPQIQFNQILLYFPLVYESYLNQWIDEKVCQWIQDI